MDKKILRGEFLENPYNGKTLGDFFYETLTKFGDSICQVDASTNQSETYRTLKDRSIRLSLNLINKYNITPTDVIINCSTNTLDSSIPMISCFFIGAIVANIHPTLGELQINHLFNLVKPTIIFVEEDNVELIETCVKNTQLECKIIVYGESKKYVKFSQVVEPLPNENQFKLAKVDVNDTALIIFSSGTTGLPKAICHSHKTFLCMNNCFINSSIDFTKLLTFSPLYWVSGLMILVSCIAQGGQRIFSKNFSAETALKIFHDYKVKTVFLPPFQLYSITSFPNTKNYSTSSVTTIITGGSSISAHQISLLNNIFPQNATMFLYGMSEIGMCSYFNVKTNKELIRRKPTSVGLPSQNVEMKCVDTKTEALLGPNQQGELRFKAPSMLIGYYRDDYTRDLDSDGFFKSGDVGYYDEENCVYIVDRIKELFRCRGFTLSPAALEHVLLEHPGIKEACVFGTPNEAAGELPTACIVLNDGFQVLEDEINDLMVKKFSEVAKFSGGIFLCDSLPRTTTGKVMRGELRKKYARN